MDLDTVSTFLAVGALVLLAVLVMLAVVALAARRSATVAGWWETVVASAGPQALHLGWAMALVATLGSLYYSEVANFEPCTLCWYQRIAMYPWAIVLGVMAWSRERRAALYVLPLVTIGFAISGYHYLLQRYPSVFPEAACSATVPCSAAWVWKFDLVSIPFMAGVSFAAIAAAVLVHRAWLRRMDSPTHDTREVTSP